MLSSFFTLNQFHTPLIEYCFSFFAGWALTAGLVALLWIVATPGGILQ